MEENKPPTAAATTKLKQAKLSFFKSTPVSVKTNTPVQGKKRRNSGSSCLDSPTKLSKSGKPLNPIATDNTECQNAKAHKIRKICNTKKIDANDHEVSSSSEAEAGITKSGSGKLDRFVCKWSQDPHHEISSTNEMFEICQQNEVPSEDIKSAVDDNNLGHLQPAVTDVAIEPDCIVIEDSMDGKLEKCDACPSSLDSLEPVTSEPTAPVTIEPVKSEPTAPNALEPVTSEPTAPVTIEPVKSKLAAPSTLEPVTSEPTAPKTLKPVKSEPTTPKTLEPVTSESLAVKTLEPVPSEPKVLNTLGPDAMDKLKQEQKEKLEKERLEKERAKEEERKKKEEEKAKREEEKKK
ncbi:unnamed protein product, partial [Candidula unifasciata]